MRGLPAVFLVLGCALWSACPMQSGGSDVSCQMCPASGAACTNLPKGTNCDSCTGSQLTPGTCDGNGICSRSAPVACGGDLNCASGTVCLSGCTKNSDCASGTCDTTTGKCSQGTTGTTGGSSTSGGSSGSGSSSTGGTTSGGTTSGGTTGGGTTTGGAGGCAPGATWQGSTCVVGNCANQPDHAPCTLATGLGECFGGTCITPPNLSTDPANCGFYGAVCPPGVNCVSAICRPDVRCNSSPPPACPTGTACADNPNYPPSGFCLPTACTGANGVACAVNGNVGGCCGTTCEDTLHDPANCGGCGVACGAGSFCNLGQCEPVPDCTAAATPTGTRCGFAGADLKLCCGSACIDVASDGTNCGACGVACPQGSTCTGGACSRVTTCTCATGMSCAGIDQCVLTTCAAGSNGLACSFQNTFFNSVGMCCASSCITPASDPSNCGACGRACAAGSICAQGSCQPAKSFDCTKNPEALVPNPPAGTFELCCQGAVAKIFTDPKNCANCGRICAATSTCAQARCVLPDGGPSICDPVGNPCPTGSSCLGGTCISDTCTAAQQGASCTIIGTAVVTGACCNGQCVNVTTDSNNCYGCGRACPTGGTCAPANCISPTGAPLTCAAGSCAAGFNCLGNYCVPVSCTGLADRLPCSFGPGVSGTCCGGACVDFRQAGNCTACGSDCPSGICTPTCVTQPTTDCPAACPAGSICALGECINGLCLASGVACATASGGVGYCCGDSACADLANDPKACGTCDVQCPTGQTCANGVCSGATPACNGRAGGYCSLATGGPGVCCGGGCIDVSSDPKNCGNCGVSCGTLTCSGGTCG